MERTESVSAGGGVAVSAMTNGELSGSSSSSTRRPVSYSSVRSADAGAYAAGGSGSVSYNPAHTNNDAWNDRPTSVHSAPAAETNAAYLYSSVIPASQRQPQAVHSNNVQEYVMISCHLTSCHVDSVLEFLLFLKILITSYVVHLSLNKYQFC